MAGSRPPISTGQLRAANSLTTGYLLGALQAPSEVRSCVLAIQMFFAYFRHSGWLQLILLFCYFAPVEAWSTAINASVRLSARPLVYLNKPHAQISPIFPNICLIPVADSRSSSDDYAIRYYALPLFGWRHIFTQWSEWARITDNVYVSSSSPGGGTGWSLPFSTAFRLLLVDMLQNLLDPLSLCHAL